MLINVQKQYNIAFNHVINTVMAQDIDAPLHWALKKDGFDDASDEDIIDLAYSEEVECIKFPKP
jgi:hypothetical protein